MQVNTEGSHMMGWAGNVKVNTATGWVRETSECSVEDS